MGLGVCASGCASRDDIHIQGLRSPATPSRLSEPTDPKLLSFWYTPLSLRNQGLAPYIGDDSSTANTTEATKRSIFTLSQAIRTKDQAIRTKEASELRTDEYNTTGRLTARTRFYPFLPNSAAPCTAPIVGHCRPRHACSRSRRPVWRRRTAPHRYSAQRRGATGIPLMNWLYSRASSLTSLHYIRFATPSPPA